MPETKKVKITAAELNAYYESDEFFQKGKEMEDKLRERMREIQHSEDRAMMLASQFRVF